MKLIMENWRKYLFEQESQEGIDQFLGELNKLGSIDAKLDYAMAKLDYVARGSSRVAYELEDRVLKIAMNPAGVEQNKVEADTNNQQVLAPFVAKIYARDPDFQWILQERVDTDRDTVYAIWDDVIGGAPHEIQFALSWIDMSLEDGDNFDEAWADVNKTRKRQVINSVPFKPIARDLVFKLHRLGINDINQQNVGIAHDGRPVILDAGFGAQVKYISRTPWSDAGG